MQTPCHPGVWLRFFPVFCKSGWLEREAQDRRLDLETIARHEAFMLQQGRERDEALAKLRVAEDKIAELRKDLAEALDSLEAEAFGDGSASHTAWHRVRENWAL